MNWKNIFHLYIFRFIQKMLNIKIHKDFLILSFNTLITTKKNSMFVSHEEDIEDDNMKTITYNTYLGEKKEIGERNLTNNTIYEITPHTVKFLEISLNIQCDYIVNHFPDYFYTDSGIVSYYIYINERKFKFEILSEFHVEDGWAYVRDVIRPDSSDIFAIGSGMYEGLNPGQSRNNLKWGVLYTCKDELQGVNIKIEKPTQNSTGHSISWITEVQKIISVKYWDITEGKNVETSFDAIYFENL